MDCQNCIHCEVCSDNIEKNSVDSANCKHFQHKSYQPCEFKGVTIKPDGEHELSAHKFVEDTTLKNVTIQILRCEKCGYVSIGWIPQDNTEEL